MEHRFAVILSADVVGYSRLMGADEEGTLAALKAIRRDLVDPKIKEQKGRIVRTMGDGLLVEFSSVVDAVRCAIGIQCAVPELGIQTPADRHIRFRMAINMGDVIADGESIYGDGVAVASRMESLAQPGGINVSRAVRDQVRDRLPIAFEDIGEHQVENIARAVRVFRIGLNEATTSPPSVTPKRAVAAPEKPAVVVLPRETPSIRNSSPVISECAMSSRVASGRRAAAFVSPVSWLRRRVASICGLSALTAPSRTRSSCRTRLSTP